MPTDTEDSGFLSRWSRRKALVRQGTALEERPAPPAAVPAASAAPPAVAANTALAGPAAGAAVLTRPAQQDQPPTALAASPAPAEPLPTLADVAALTRDSDYSRFVARTVQPDVKNAALAKLFTDPHFNVMDGLDTYIDDYSQPDPLPPGMLRQMLQSQMLGLFDDETPAQRADPAGPAGPADLADPAAPAAPDMQAAPAAAPPTPTACDETLICNCNQTMTLDAPALQQALKKTPGAHTDGLDTVHTLLCRREAPAFQRAAKATSTSGDELLVACTQESRLFLELNDQTEGAAQTSERPIRFVNLRETSGWTRDKASTTPKMAALLAVAQLPVPDAVATASYRSGGRCLVVGPALLAEQAAALLEDKLDVTVLVSSGGSNLHNNSNVINPPASSTAPSALAQVHGRATHTGRLTHVSGWLGQFKVQWTSNNPIDLDLCTRCNACVDACPEGAIGLDYQVNLAACKSHRDCVRVCDAAGAIDFQRQPLVHDDSFDLVLDLQQQPAFAQHQPPQGYFHVPAQAASSSNALMKAVLQLRDLVGEFEKPRFFRYQHKLCAHSRNEKIGCTACIDVCSAQAVRSDASRKGKAKGELGGGIIVEPHLCVGCGACSTVCPSGALTFGYPGPETTGRRLRTALTAYQHAGGRDAALLLHSEQAGTRALDELGRRARSRQASTGAANSGLQGLPARVLPLPLWHTASVGIDLWLAALAQGASQVWVLLTDEEAPEYRQALTEQMAVAQAVMTGLGYSGEHFKLLQAGGGRNGSGADNDLHTLDQALRAPAAQTVKRVGTFAAQADKRATLELAIDHLLAQAPSFPDAPETLPLPSAGSPFGTLVVDSNKCTLCLSCVSACPEAALADNPDKPQLKFIEKNCVQCGLCASTCPEGAITLQPRLWLADGGKARKAPRVLAEMEPYRCVRCSKPFGTLLAIENMITKLAGHSAFQGAAVERLKMCGDCRVIDLHSNPNEVRITDL